MINKLHLMTLISLSILIICTSKDQDSPREVYLLKNYLDRIIPNKSKQGEVLISFEGFSRILSYDVNYEYFKIPLQEILNIKNEYILMTLHYNSTTLQDQHSFKLYKALKKSLKYLKSDFFYLKNDCIDIRSANIADILMDLLSLMIKCRYRIGKSSKCKLYYFGEHQICKTSFEKFIKSFKYLKLVKIDDYKSINMISVTYFVGYLNFRFFRDFSRDKICFYPEIRSFFKKMYFNIINELKNNTLVLPIFDDYDKEFYLAKIYHMISEELLRSKNIVKILQLNQINHLQNLGKSVMKKSFHKYFNKKLNELKDFMIIERMVCDYYNMIFKDKNSFFKPFVKPVTINEYSWFIFRALEIKLNLSEIVTAHDSNGDKINLKKGDVVYEISTNVLYYPFRKIRDRDIYEIRIYNSENEMRRRFIIKDDLN